MTRRKPETPGSAGGTAMRVPLLDLAAQFETIRGDLLRAVGEVFESQRFINGPQIAQLEEKIAAYCSCPAAVGASSGTDALLMTLMTLGIGPGDEVVTTPYTFFATAGSIARLGAKPVFVDIEPDSFNIDVTRIEAAITGNTRAILPVHLFGQMADMDAILEIAERHDLAVIEDAAQAIGATSRGRKAGSLGTAGCFSFFPTKNLGAAGDAGMVVTRDAELGEKLRQCRNHGSKPKYFHRSVGGNFRLDTLQAAVLLAKFEHLETWHAGRQRNAARYDELLAEVPTIVTPKIRADNVSIFHQYVIRVPRADGCVQYLRDNGIGCEVYYPLSLHQQECFAHLGYRKGDFPEAERAAAGTLALPIYPELRDEQIRTVVDALRAYVASVA